MQSDGETTEILRVFERQATAFRSALSLAVEDVRATIRDQEVAASHMPDARAAELGSFAAGRMQAERFLELTSPAITIDSDAEAHMQAAFDTLSKLSARGETLFRVRVPTGGDLRDAVATAYKEIGRAFGAARVVAAAKQHAFDESEHGTLLDGLPYRRWNDAERSIAPPLVVGVDGGDLFVSALAEFLDGNTKIILHVRGDCPPAPLVRLVNSSTYVVQRRRIKRLGGLARFDGPGIGALVPQYAAHFVHDPAAGPTLAERLQIAQFPVDEPRMRIGGYSSRQQVQDVEQLMALATRARPPETPPPAPVEEPPPVETSTPAAAVPQATPAATAPAADADQLAAWLIAQTGLGNGA
ncbi:MAG: hypothetical protein QNJ98_18355 [Planctomycetota bacterium]|nr:hypothetical protein [Planctomycetota bacterium]